MLCATPAVAMQLLQMWLQSFQEPVLSLPLQQTIAALLRPAAQSTSSEASHPAATSVTQLNVVTVQQDVSIYNAVVQHLSAQQQTVLARLVACVQAVRKTSNGNEAHVRSVLLWLTRHLTVGDADEAGMTCLSRGQTALLHFLEVCTNDAVVLQLLMPSKASELANAAQQGVTSIASDQSLHQTDNLAAEPSEMQHVLKAREGSTGCSMDSQPLETARAADTIQAYTPQAIHLADRQTAHESDTTAFQPVSTVGAGCLRFSSQLAKKVFARAV